MTMIRLAQLYAMLFLLEYRSAELRQELTKVIYSNPKFIANVSAVTRRVSRREPLRTNITATLLMPYGNNVTFALILQLKSGGDFKIVSKVCDTVKTKWMQKYMSQFTNLTLSKCPFPSGTYAYINLELPPRNVPVPVMDGDYYIIMELSLTATKERIMSVSTLIHPDELSISQKNTKNKNRNDKKG